MRRGSTWGVLALMAMAGAPTVGAAQILAASTFGGGSVEGWRGGEFYAGDGSVMPAYSDAGGNPGGFLRLGDIAGWSSFHAPAAFLGNKTAAYGGRLSLDTRIAFGDGSVCPVAAIGNGATTLVFRAPEPALNTWTTFHIPLIASAGWTVATGSCAAGAAASETQLQAVLGDLRFLNVNADWRSGGDQVDLDNVILAGPGLTAVPEPATVTLLGAGVLALGGVAARRRRTA